MSTGVRVGASAPLLLVSQATAIAIFKRIGVQLTWRYGRRRPAAKTITTCTGKPATRDIAIEIVAEAPAHNGALAETSLNRESGARIVIFYDRVESLLKRQRAPEATILGYVLAHEIGHALQGVVHHSASGVMRATWTTDDFEQMREDGLRFTEEDVLLIRLGLAPPNAPADCSEPPSG